MADAVWVEERSMGALDQVTRTKTSNPTKAHIFHEECVVFRSIRYCVSIHGEAQGPEK